MINKEMFKAMRFFVYKTQKPYCLFNIVALNTNPKQNNKIPLMLHVTYPHIAFSLFFFFLTIKKNSFFFLRPLKKSLKTVKTAAEKEMHKTVKFQKLKIKTMEKKVIFIADINNKMNQ